MNEGFASLYHVKLLKKFLLPYAMIYDPLGYGFKFIKKMEEKNGVQVASITEVPESEESADQQNTKALIKDCIDKGIPLILRDIDTKVMRLVEPILMWRYYRYFSKIKQRSGATDIEMMKSAGETAEDLR